MKEHSVLNLKVISDILISKIKIIHTIGDER